MNSRVQYQLLGQIRCTLVLGEILKALCWFSRLRKRICEYMFWNWIFWELMQYLLKSFKLFWVHWKIMWVLRSFYFILFEIWNVKMMTCNHKAFHTFLLISLSNPLWKYEIPFNGDDNRLKQKLSEIFFVLLYDISFEI